MIGFYKNKVQINLNSSKDVNATLLSDPDDSQESRPSNANGYAMVMPVKLRVPGGEFWTFPVEPLVSISGGNIIAKSQVAKGKGRGTIKERWSQDDYTVNIEGVMINMGNANAYPEADVRKLRELCESREALEIECDLCKIYDISRIAVVSHDVPFTKGEANQRFTISALSDDIEDLLVDIVKPLT